MKSTNTGNQYKNYRKHLFVGLGGLFLIIVAIIFAGKFGQTSAQKQQEPSVFEASSAIGTFNKGENRSDLTASELAKIPKSINVYEGSLQSPNTGLTIIPTFDSSITSNPNSAAIQAMINQAIGIYQAQFSDPITVNILFRYSTTQPDGSPMPSDNLARSNYVIYNFPWNTYTNFLVADATTTNDTIANVSLPSAPITTNIVFASANGRAIGLNTLGTMTANGTIGTGNFDGIVTLNSAQPFMFTRPTSGNSYDALRSTEHEIDEVLGLGSFIGNYPNLRPQDLFSWSSPGTRNLTSNGTRYFSGNNGTTNLVAFNQVSGSDYGDWFSPICPQPNPYVQNAVSCPGQFSDVTATSPEGINLDIIGYNLNVGGTCTYTINPQTSPTIPASGGIGTVTVTTSLSSCAWTSTSNATWITITSGSSGSGTGTVGYLVQANTGAARMGTITIAGQTFTVNQAAGSCPPASTISFGQTINGNLQNGDCLYTDNSYYDAYTFSGTAGQQIFITMNSTQFNAYLFLYQGGYPGGILTANNDDGGGGTNARIPATAGFFSLPATATYTILANSLDSGETGNYSLTLGTNCVYSINPGSANIAASGATGSTSVTTAPGCAWTAVSNVAWLTTSSTGSGTTGTVNYSYTTNSGAARSGTITVGTQTFTVNQAAGCIYSLNPTSQSFPASGGSNSVQVTTQTGCAWTAVSNSFADFSNNIFTKNVLDLAQDVLLPSLSQPGFEKSAPTNDLGRSETTETEAVMTPAFTEGFDDVTTLPGSGWFLQNNSVPVGTTNWFQGGTIFPAQSGAATSWIGANFNNTTGTNTLSNWLLTPNITFNNGDTVTFYTRTTTASPYPDRLQVRLSTNGTSTNVGTGATGVGDFTRLLLDINPTYTTGTYPEVWTPYTMTISGLASPTSGRLAFRYFVENGGPAGTNSNLIGIDSFSYNPATTSNWITVTSGGSGNGNGTVNYSVAANTTGAARNGTITIGQLPFTVNQASVSTIPVTVQSNPVGRSFTVDGTNYTATQTFTWESGSSHTIATTSPQAGTAGTQYLWTSWSDSGALSHTVTPTAATTYTANFTTQYQITIIAGSNGTVSPASGTFYNAGQTVPITATPNSGFTFANWAGTGSGSYSGTNNPATVTMSAPITQTASFSPVVCNYSISPANASVPATIGTGSFTVTITASCAWTATSNAAWLTTSSTGSGITGTVNYSYTANTGAARSGIITVGTQTFTVNQAGTTTQIRRAFDFDGDGKADVSVFRPSNTVWYASKSSDSQVLTAQWGIATDKIVPADFNGDGKTDYAVFRDGFWYVLLNGGGFEGYQWGSAGDIPFPADFDGDGKDDLCVFRNGTWFVRKSSGGTITQNWGSAGDIPVVADYDGDGKADFAVFRNGIWYVLKSTGGDTAIQWGIAGDKPVQADYNGDGKADYAVFRNGFWYILYNGGGFQGAQWGASGDLAAPADYDGDGKTDLAVFRAGTWYIQRTTAGVQVVNFGSAGDKPVPNAFVP